VECTFGPLIEPRSWGCGVDLNQEFFNERIKVMFVSRVKRGFKNTKKHLTKLLLFKIILVSNCHAC
jgi:hypothetical protein